MLFWTNRVSTVAIAAQAQLLQVQNSGHLAAFAGKHIKCARRGLRIHYFQANIAPCECEHELSRGENDRRTGAKDDYFGLCREHFVEVLGLKLRDTLFTPRIKYFISCNRYGSLMVCVADHEAVVRYAADHDGGWQFARELQFLFPLPFRWK